MKEKGYCQPQKNFVRKAALSHAVAILTSSRPQASCVRRGYVRDVKEKLLAKGLQSDKEFAEFLPDHYISVWEDFYDASVGTKKPSELTVCYLSGPEPENDFQVLVDEGIHPHNIWAFESDNVTYEKALKALENLSYSMLKIHKGSIEQYFINTPKKFDIVYIDACGPLPSPGQHTLRLISTLLRHHRLSSPGVIITNFASPDLSDTLQHDNYSYLVSSYLYNKSFIEGYHKDNYDEPVAVEGPPVYSLLPDSNDPNESFLSYVRDNFHFYYSQYITRQIFDLASVIIPWVRFANAPYWNKFFTVTPKDIQPYASKMQCFDKNWGGGDIITEEGMYPLQWTICAMYGGGYTGRDINYPSPPENITRFRESWLRELMGMPALTFDARSAVECYDVLRESQELYSDRFRKIVTDFPYMRKMHMFCDAPTYTLAFDLLVNQLSYPMHYSVDPIRRWSYLAKNTRMFTDVVFLDECRYIYEWLPTIDLLESGFLDIRQQLTYRFALDGLAKNRRWYNTEYFYGAAVIDQHTRSFEAKVLAPRVTL
jgi:hypothetical protein